MDLKGCDNRKKEFHKNIDGWIKKYFKNKPGSNKSYISNNIIFEKKPLICDICNKIVHSLTMFYHKDKHISKCDDCEYIPEGDD